ncbi:MAG: DUF2341 domain-containing protein [Thermoplasmata archaeon]|nr:MAG: DUF2341 domain-containing protein [Thermoplasmata archaeon]
MYYGNPGASNQSSPLGVWDENYTLVYHMNETGSGAINDFKDSTVNSYDGWGGGGTGTKVPGRRDSKIGYGQRFDGSDDYIDVSSMNPQTYVAFTISTWYKSNNDTTSDDEFIFAHEEVWATGPGWFLSIDDAAGIRQDTPHLYIWDDVLAQSDDGGGYDVVDQQYHYISVSRTPFRIQMFVDGLLFNDEIDVFGGASFSVDAPAGPYIGDWPLNTEAVDGFLDEFRLSNIGRPLHWVKTEYNNQNDPASFYTVGSQESTSSLSSGYEWVELYNKGSTAADLTGWNLTDNDGNRFSLSGAGSVPAGGYLVCHIGESGTNSSSNVYGQVDGPRIQPGPTEGLDNFLDDSTPTLNYETLTNTWAQSEGGTIKKPIIEFDLGTLEGDVIDATISMDCNGGTVGSSTIGVHRVTQAWTEAGSTWNTYDGTNNWATAGGDYVATAEDSDTFTIPFGWRSWSVTEMVNGWVSGKYQNNGMIFVPQGTSYGKFFRSSDYDIDPSLRPYLEVTYRGNMLGYADDLALINSNNDTIDYIAWGKDAADDDDSAASADKWTDGDYIDITSVSTNETIGRNSTGGDTELPADWEGPATSRADPFGVRSGSCTQGLANLDQYGIVINEVMLKPTGGPYETDWSYSKKITIHSGYIDDDLRDFPMMFTINSTDLKDNALANGYDIMFTDAERDTKLDHEIERWDATTGELIAWVKIPYLSSTEDTEIYMYYGNSGSENQQNPEGVWSNGYLGVYHMYEATGPVNNSVSERFNAGRANTPTRAYGQIGYCQEFTGLNEYDLFYIGDMGMHDDVQKNISFSAWIKLDKERSDDYAKILTKRNVLDTGYGNYLQLNNEIPKRFVGTINNHALGSQDYGNYTWIYATMSYDGSSIVEYVNDSAVSTQSWTDALAYSNAPWTIGGRDVWSQEVKGFIDEVRISNAPRSGDWVKAEYFNQYSPESFYSIGDWVNRKAITINSSKVAGDLTDFPIYINITDSDLASDAQPTGHDIYFTSSDGETKLDHEITYYEPNTGNMKAWIKIPTLSSSINTTIYMYYNNLDSGNNSNPYGVWNENYRGVWHFQDQSLISVEDEIKDTSLYGNHLRSVNMDNSDQVDGKLDGSFEYDGVDDYMRRNNVDINGLNMGTSDFTVEAWVKVDNPHTDTIGSFVRYGGTADTTAGYWLFWYDSQDYLSFRMSDGTTRAIVNSYKSIEDGLWHHVVGVADRDGKGMIYIDGQLDNGDDWTAWDGNNIYSTQNIFFSHNGDYLDGNLDEVKIISVAWSHEWINTTYQNQNDPGSFVTVGVEEDLGVWYDSDWSYRKNITINSSLVDEGVRDFPVLINITDTDLKNDARSDGYDIVFTQGSARLDHEIEYYDSSSGQLIAWVKLPWIPSTVDKNISMYYGNSDQSLSMENAEGVWSNGFLGVYHMVESSGSISNSATKFNDGTRGDSPTRVSARIGYGQEFTGSTGDDRFTLGDFGITDGVHDQLTLSFWMNADDANMETWGRVILKRDESDTTTYWGAYFDDDASGKDLYFTAANDGGANQVGLGVWVYVSFTYDGSTKDHYHNGSWVRDDTGGSGPLYPSASSAPVTIGARVGGSQNFAGILDEVRIAKVTRSAGWVLTEYNSLNDSANFTIVNSEETYSAGSSDSIGTYYEWVELYNPTSQNSNLNDLYLFDNDGGKFDLSGAGSLASGSYLMCYLGESGTNSSTDVYGPVINTHKSSGSMLDINDDLVIASSQGYITDYIAWGVDPVSDDDIAVSYTQWTSGTYINSTELVTNETLGRDKHSTETNSTANWENPTSYLADPYGLHAWSQTPGAINLDRQVVINEVQFNQSNDFNERWGNRKKITIDSTKLTGDLTNFPVLISITDKDIANRSQPDGDDIMFIAADEVTKYNHEIESFDTFTSTLVAWVNITTLSPSTDTELYIYYNNPEAEDQSNATGVWDSGHVGVWHLDETGTGAADEFDDSTSYDNDGRGGSGNSNQVPTNTDAKIGKGQFFDGFNDYINCGSDSSVDITGKAITLEAWITWQDDTEDLRGPLSHSGWVASYRLLVSKNSQKLSFQLPGDTYNLQSTTLLSADSWYHITAVYNGDKMNNYIDSLKDTSEMSKSDDVESEATAELWIGHGDDEYGQAWSYPWNGSLDEVRVSKVARSWDWINASYNNQYDPTSFYSIGAEEIISDAWMYRKNITIESDQVDGDMINFPVLISHTDSNLANTARPDGYDIVFTKADGKTMYNHELERYTSPSGELTAWVNITYLSSSTDTYIYMYYGNPECYDQSSSDDVWDDNYVGVWHFNETYDTVYDSTTNDIDMTPVNSISQFVDGKIDRCIETSGGDQERIEVADNSLLDPSSITVEAWFNTDVLPAVNGEMFTAVSKSDSSWADGYIMCFQRQDGAGWDDFMFLSDLGDWEPAKYPSTNFDRGQWYHAVGTYNSSIDTSKLYINGTLKDTSNPWAGAIIDSSNTLKFGDNDWEEWEGKLDEIRISNIVRTDEWLSTSFNTQNLSGFYSVGNEESTGADLDYEWVEIYNNGSTAIDLTGWYLTDNDGNTFDLSGATSIAPYSYVVAHLGESGTNSTTDVYGSISGTGPVRSVTIQPGSASGMDVHLYEGAPDEQNGEDQYFESADYNDGGKENLLFQFDLSFVPTSTIVEAKLWLYRHTGSGTVDGHVNVRRITHNWTEAYVSWNDYDGVNPWDDGGGGDYAEKIYSWKTVNPTVLRWYDWNVTELIHEWKEGTYPNYGFCLEAHWSSAWQQFRSSDYNADITIRPTLVVNYSVPSTLQHTMLEDSDDLSLCDSNGDIIDYIAWGADPGEDDDAAVTRGLWTEGVYIDTTGLAENETIGRDKDSEDNDTAGDWENATSGYADPYGIDTPIVTPGAQNFFIIPEFEDITFSLILIAITVVFIVFKRQEVRGKRQKQSSRS